MSEDGLRPEHFDDLDHRPRLTQAQVNDYMQKHEMYLRGQVGGRRLTLAHKDLSRLDMSGRDLSQADFTGCAMLQTDLSDTSFNGGSFFGADLRNANLKRADLTRVDLRGVNLSGADLSETNMKEADMREGRILQRAQQGGFEDSRFSATQDARTVLVGAKLVNADLTALKAQNAEFQDADLSGIVMPKADLSGANFAGANLTDMILLALRWSALTSKMLFLPAQSWITMKPTA